LNKLKTEMTKDLITIAWDRSMERAHKLMKENGIRHLAVTDEAGTIQGILSSKDVARAMHHSRGEFPFGTAVCNYASSPVVTVNREASLADVADTLVREKISALLVTDNEEKIVGIVTSEDLLALFGKLVREAEGKSPVTRALPVIGELLRELNAAGI
jgi:CBS domain-containing protein